MAIDKKLRIFDTQGNEQDYDIMATDVKFLPDGKDLPTKLDEMQTGIDNAGQVNEIIMNGQTYTPTNKVIDLGTVITQHQDISGKVDKVTGKGLSTNDFTDALLAKLNSLDPYTKAQVDALIAASSSGAVSVTTNQDGTFTIHVGDTDYTINLNHTHENMAKVVKCTSETLPETLANDTIYVQVDDATTPTEIESLWLFGLEFVGGGEPDTTARLISPRRGLTIAFDGQSTQTLVVKGKNLLSAISLAVTGDFTVTLNGSSVSTISASDAETGVTLTLTKGSNFSVGTLTFSSNDFESMVVNIVESEIETLPSGYTRLSFLTGITSWISTNIYSAGSEWEFDVTAGSQTAETEILAAFSSAGAGQYGGGCKNGYWGLGVGEGQFTSVAKTTRATIRLGWSSTHATMTIGNETITRAIQDNSNDKIHLLGTTSTQLNNPSQYCLRGQIYSVKCITGGSFIGIPAERDSDNKQGIYDTANDVFYPLK